MNSNELREQLETLKESELIKQIQRYVCQSLADADDPAAESHVMLDLIYVECLNRGKERLYDKVYESVCREPQVCEVLRAA